jgi:MOSC domain-containing protein YiiM
MHVEHIFTRRTTTREQVEHQSVSLLAGAGIEGDRYFDLHDEPGQNITFVEAEEIEAFLSKCQRKYDPSVTGRNVVTRGVRLNEFVGKEFVVGDVRFRGVELCEPCLVLGEALQSETLTPAQVVRHWVHRAGIRADVLSTGVLSVGAGVANAA